MNTQNSDGKMNRRSFLRSTAAAGAGLAFSPMVLGQAAGSKPDDINVALLVFNATWRDEFAGILLN